MWRRVVARKRPLEWAAVVVALFIVFVGLYRSYPHPWNARPTFVSPRQQVTYELSKQWSESGKPTLTEPLLVELDDDIAAALVPRDGSAYGDEIVPKDFPITVAIYALAHEVGSRFVPLVSPALACVALLCFALTALRVTGSKRATWIATALLASTTAFWISSAALVAGDAAGLAGMMLAIGGLVRIADQQPGTSRRDAGTPDRGGWWAVVAGLGFAVAIASRYTLVGPVVMILGTFAIRHRGAWRRFALAGAATVIACTPVFVYHNWLYGGPLQTAYGISDKTLKERVRFEGRGLTTINVGRIIDHVRIYLTRPEIAALWIAACVAIALLLLRKAGRAGGTLTTLAWATPLVTVPLVLYHGGQGLWGSVAFATNSSFLRYLIPVFALWCLLAAWLLDKLAARSAVWRDRAIAIAAVIALLALRTSFTGAGGVEDLRVGVPAQAGQAQVVFDHTPSDALVITRTGSKALWPDRRTLNATLLYDGPPITDEKILVWDVVPSPERLADVAGRLVTGGHDVFVYDDGPGEGWLTDADIGELRHGLQAFGLDLVDTLPERETSPLYHVVLAAS